MAMIGLHHGENSPDNSNRTDMNFRWVRKVDETFSLLESRGEIGADSQ